MSIPSRQAEHLTPGQQRSIRLSDKTSAQLARFYGVKAATIDAVRKPARRPRRELSFGIRAGKVTRQVGEPKRVAPVGGLTLHVEGGPDLPQPLH